MEMPVRKSCIFQLRMTSIDKKLLEDLAYEQGIDVSKLFDFYIQALKFIRPYLSRYNVKFVVESAFGSVVASDLESIPLLHKGYEEVVKNNTDK